MGASLETKVWTAQMIGKCRTGGFMEGDRREEVSILEVGTGRRSQD
jgi:hypothetical protein